MRWTWGCVGCVAVAVTGCIEAEPYSPELVVTVAQDAVLAGEPVAWSARLVDGTSESQAVVVAFESDLEPGIAYSGRELFPRVAGAHALTARASVDGEYRTTNVVLDVMPALADQLEVVLDRVPAVAGESVGYTVRAVDSFGNAIEPEGLLLTGDAAVSIDTTAVSATQAGDWVLTAQLDAQMVEVPFPVVAGPPETLTLEVESYIDTVTTTVQLTDGYGNPVPASTELQVHGVEHVVLGSVVYFLGEGEAQIVAVEPESGLTSNTCTVQVDWSAPELSIDTPARGAWLSIGTVDFSGTAVDAVSGPVTLEVDGTAVALTDGTWTHPVDVDFGMTVVETLAYDSAGYLTRDLRALVAGDVRPIGETEVDGLLFRLDEDASGLGAVERMAEADLVGVNLADEDENPVYSDAERSCSTQFGATVCVWTRLDVDLDQVAYETATVSLDGQSTGRLTGLLTLENVFVDWSAGGELSDVPFSDTGRGTASEMLVDFELSFAVIDDVIEVTASNVQVDLRDFDMGASADMEAASASLGSDLNALIGEVVEDAAAAVLPGIVEDAVEASFADLNVTIGWPRGSGLLARPTEVQVDAQGLAIRFGTLATLDAWALDTPEHGALVRSSDVPDWTHAHPAAMALSLNTLNQIFHANWGGGFLNVEGRSEAFEIDMAVFNAALPGIRTLVGTLRATYPPLFVPDATGQLRMELPELRVEFYDGEVIEDTAVYAIYLTLSTPVELALDDNRLDLVWGEQDVWMDIEHAPQDADLFFLETLLESFSAGLVLNDYELVDALPLPTIGGSTLQGATVEFAGADEAYLVIDGGFRVD